MWAQRIVAVVLIGLWVAGWFLGHGRAFADEPVPAKPEPTPVKPEWVRQSWSLRRSNHTQRGVTQSLRRRHDILQTGARPRKPTPHPQP